MIHEHFKLSVRNPLIAGHQVFGQPLLPGLAYIDLIYQAFNKHGFSFQELELRNLAIHQPLLVSSSEVVRLEIHADQLAPGVWGIRLEAANVRDGMPGNEYQLYAEAQMRQTIKPINFDEHLVLEKIQNSAASQAPLEDMYRQYREQELVHTGLMKADGMVYDCSDDVILDVGLGRDAESSAHQFLFHPTLIDGSGVGSGRFLAPPVAEEPRLFLPLYYESFRASELLQRQCVTRVRRDSLVHRHELMSWTLEFFNSAGRKVAELRNFTAKLVREAGWIHVSHHPARSGVGALNDTHTQAGSAAQERNEHIEHPDSIEALLIEMMAGKLGVPDDQVNPHAGYYELGLDSSGLLGMVKDIESRIGVSLSPTLLFEHTTITELADYLHKQYGDRFSSRESAVRQGMHDIKRPSVDVQQEADADSTDLPNAEGDIAIIGMSGRYPQAENIREFWTNLLNGRNSVTEVPSSRWETENMEGVKSPSGKAMSKWGGFIDDPDAFDPKFFRISPREAETMDPQERLFLEVCWEAIEDAGYTPDTLVPPRGSSRRRKVGVFAGVMHKDYSLIGADAMAQGAAFPLSLQTGPIANRVSYYCDFHGPSMTVDTLCSSSLTAVHLAIESLRRGESEAALAGGVNLSLHPAKYMTYGLWGMHSSDGRCRTFGKDGDGYVSSEGVAAVLLKPLSKAIADQDRIYAVIKASSVNHVGTVSGMMVPGPVAQAEVISDCIRQAGIDPRTIGYVEAHGTGTSLGDPIEMEGLIRAFGETHDHQYCAIGSVKSNIGHAESAAGVIGLQKAALQIYHQMLVPSLHAEELNPYIDFEHSPFYVQEKTETWNRPVVERDGVQVSMPRRAGLSSFGATGSNAHLLLEEYIEPEGRRIAKSDDQSRQGTKLAVPLSAKNKERLMSYAYRLLDYLKQASVAEQNPNSSNGRADEAGIKERLEAVMRGYLARILCVEADLIESGVPWGDYGVEPVHLQQMQDMIRDQLQVEMEQSELTLRSSVSSAAADLLKEHPEAARGISIVSAEVPPAEDTVKNRLSLADVAYTLQVGRIALEERVVFVVEDMGDLIRGLQALLDGADEIPCGFRGQVKPCKPTTPGISPEEVSQQVQFQNIESLAKAWVLGAHVDWVQLYGDHKPSRISLPTYPFAKEKYWIPTEHTRVAASARQITTPVNTIHEMHPLLHRNASVFGQQRFETVFTGNEFYLTDHKVQGQKVLPGVAYLEMVRAALLESLDAAVRSETPRGVRLKNTAWIRPFIVNGSAEKLHIRLFPDPGGRITFEIFSEAGGADEVIHSTGQAEAIQDLIRPVLDLDQIIRECGVRSYHASQIYEEFRLLGMDYGEAHRGIEAIHAGDGQVLAKLLLPGHLSPAIGSFVLHPSLMDSALQATIGLRNLSTGSLSQTPKPVMPFALQELEVISPCTPHMWAWIRQREDSVNTQKLDIDLCDDEGRVCVRMKGFSTRMLEGGLIPRRSPLVDHEHRLQNAGAQAAAPFQETREVYPAADTTGTPEEPHHDFGIPVGNVHLIPVWDEVSAVQPTAAPVPPIRDRVIIVGERRHAALIQHYYPQAQILHVVAEDSAAAISGKLQALGRIDHIVWSAPDSHVHLAESEEWIHAQERGVLSLFKLVQALLEQCYAERALQWTVITVDTQPAVGTERVNPAHAGVHGLAGSMVKEYPAWSVRIADLERDCNWPLDEIFAIPAERRGHPWAYRNGTWYRHSLIPVQFTDAPERSLLRTGGVYVVIGGAGGIGKAFSEYLVRSYQARIIWIGRRPVDEDIEAEASRIAAFGPKPEYVSADAANLDSLREAYKAVKRKHSAINGVIHSAMVLEDQELAGMSEDAFRAGLKAKLDVSVRLAQVFEGEALDFVLFFSSLISFIKNPRQSHYASGSAFKDAFAHRLSQDWSCQVKIMNWGYWSSPEAGVSDEVKQLARIGMGLIEPEDGMKAVELLLSGPIRQLALIKTTKPLIVEGMDQHERVRIVPATLHETITWKEQIPDRSREALELLNGMHRQRDTENVLVEMLLSQLMTMGMFQGGSCTREVIRLQTGISAMYDRWLEESLSVLEKQGRLVRAGDAFRLAEDGRSDLLSARAAWEQHKGKWLKDPSLKPWMELAGELLQGLPDILRGKRPATDFMFPDSSMRRVEGIYKNNPVADYFNEVLADSVLAIIDEILQRNPAAKIRLVEIGAGTGGTSSLLFRRLEPYRDHIEEYCYTDISKAFLLHAENEYGPHVPYLTYDLFNVDHPASGQMTKNGSFDIAIAANVLHATRNIRETLRNAKALLKKNGYLLINELSRNQLLTHLTFGLLEGWWLYNDPQVRIPGCPGLSPDAWQSVLESEGYGRIEFPAARAHPLGQQIIAAASNGWVRHRKPEDRADKRLVRSRSAPAHTASQVIMSDEGGVSTSGRRIGQAARSPQTEAETKALSIAGAWPNGAGHQASSGHDEAIGEQLEHHVRSIIMAKLSEALKVDPQDIDLDESFADYGLDSIIGVHLVQILNQALNIELDTTSLFDYSSVRQLTAYIMTDHRDGAVQTWKPLIQADVDQRVAVMDSGLLPEALSDSQEITADPPAVTGAAAASAWTKPFQPIHETLEGDREPIAIIGMSGRFAQSENVDELWEHLSRGDELIGTSPRWNLSDYYPPGTPYCEAGGFVNDIDKFDPFFFNINGLEATYMDPQQRIFMEECWKALEDSGYAGTRIQGTPCGVYVGCLGGAGDYSRLSGSDSPPQAFWGMAGSVIPARIAYYLDLKGPAIAVDTACSSSLVAVHLACQGLKSGETDMALAGGVFIQSTPWYYLSTNKAGMLSATGHSYTFDERADGFVPGEGAGVLVLKRLKDAVADGDHIYGVIRGSGLNQDGTTNGITAPSALSQERLECGVYDKYGIDPSHIQVVEAHGTGTRLGDPIEYQALTRAFRKYTDQKEYCAIGSIKTNIGHAAHAAGVAGIIKILLSLKHKQIPPTLHFQKGNPNIAFGDSPFYVNTRLKAWNSEPHRHRLAAVSSFGFSGTNAHIVIEEAPAAERIPSSRPGYLIVLSARTTGQLHKQVRQLADYTAQHPQTPIANISYTLMLGRKHLHCRFACVARTIEELRDQLNQWMAGSQPTQVYTAEFQENERKEQLSLKRYGNQCIHELQTVRQPDEYIERLTVVAELYVQGYVLDMKDLFTGGGYTVVSLPTYPFEKESYWIPERSVQQEPAQTGLESQLFKGVNHPLLHQNMSDLSGVRFHTTITRSEAFLNRDEGNGGHRLPGMALVEMAREAAARSAGSRMLPTNGMILREVVWSRPVEIDRDQVTLGVEVFMEADETESIAFEIFSLPQSEGSEPAILSQGTVSFPVDMVKNPVNLENLQKQCSVHFLSKLEWYRLFEASHIVYPAAQQVIDSVWIGSGQVLAKISAASLPDHRHGQMMLHPVVLDQALQLVSVIDGSLTESGDQVRFRTAVLPVKAAELHILGRCTSEIWVHVWLSEWDDGRRDLRTVHLDLYDEQGFLCTRMNHLAVTMPERELLPAVRSSWIGEMKR